MRASYSNSDDADADADGNAEGAGAGGRRFGHGYAGIDSELYIDPKTAMLFGDAEVVLSALLVGLGVHIH